MCPKVWKKYFGFCTRIFFIQIENKPLDNALNSHSLRLVYCHGYAIRKKTSNSPNLFTEGKPLVLLLWLMVLSLLVLYNNAEGDRETKVTTQS